ncbi:MAG: hypothetical protein KR126chlam1_00233 [Chlamydiae bacterium]|nr:hypothetical protein [Chlamydiota bacterium]
MIKKTATMIMLSSSALVATEVMPEVSDITLASLCSTCCQPCCECEPCCVPKPKKCIDCECYTPQFYDLQCDFGFYFDVEFLYWYAKEQHLPLAVESTIEPVLREDGTPKDFLLPKKEIFMDSRWDPGFRLGVGFNSECDGWDYYLSWTYMHNKRTRSRSVAPFEDENTPSGTNVLLSPWDTLYPVFVDGDDPQISGYDHIKGKWRLNYNVVDLELGRKYWLSQCFNFRPFVGLRGAWSRLRFRVKNSFEPTDESIHNALSTSVAYKNRIWGVGFLGGIQPTWYYSSCFALYGNANIALLWGRDDVSRKESIGILPGPGMIEVINPSYSTSACVDGMQGVLDLAIGLRYEDTYCCDRYRFTFDLGWEHHQWFNYAHKFKVLAIPVDTIEIGNGFVHLDDFNTDLGLGGLVLRVRFDF